VRRVTWKCIGSNTRVGRLENLAFVAHQPYQQVARVQYFGPHMAALAWPTRLARAS
jgi:hypothetical protein